LGEAAHLLKLSVCALLKEGEEITLHRVGSLWLKRVFFPSRLVWTAPILRAGERRAHSFRLRVRARP
jgi:hypothetical protein